MTDENNFIIKIMQYFGSIRSTDIENEINSLIKYCWKEWHTSINAASAVGKLCDQYVNEVGDQIASH